MEWLQAIGSGLAEKFFRGIRGIRGEKSFVCFAFFAVAALRVPS